MDKRKRIGLFFSYNTNWIGGTYYWLNWLNALNTLPEEEKPTIVILSDHRSFQYVAQETRYPHLEHYLWHHGYTLWQKIVNAVALRTMHKRVCYDRLTIGLDAILPCGIGETDALPIADSKRINWFPDFQFAHLPEFYTPQTYVAAYQGAVAAAYLSNKLMLSSEDAARDFRRLFPDSKAKVYVQHFTVTHPSIDDVDVDMVMSKFGIERPYFYSPNQYWAHKNHKIVIEAVAEMVKRGNNDILVLFSGKEWDDRNLDYVPALKRLVSDLGLEKNIKFLGFIDRKEQLVIMKFAKAVIQPSLFEGWSTVIEDAQALGKYVIASDLAVNREQIGENVDFFDPHDATALAKIMEKGNFDVVSISYDNRRLEQAKRFMKMIEE